MLASKTTVPRFRMRFSKSVVWYVTSHVDGHTVDSETECDQVGNIMSY